MHLQACSSDGKRSFRKCQALPFIWMFLFTHLLLTLLNFHSKFDFDPQNSNLKGIKWLISFLTFWLTQMSSSWDRYLKYRVSMFIQAYMGLSSVLLTPAAKECACQANWEFYVLGCLLSEINRVFMAISPPLGLCTAFVCSWDMSF